MGKRFLPVVLGLLCLLILCSCESFPGKKSDPDVIFETTPHKVVREMLKLAGVKCSDTVYDLGSGDGRIVIAAAKDFGANGVGVEIDKNLIDESIRNAGEAGVGDRVRFVQEDFFHVNLSDATVVTMYLLPKLNVRLAPKFLEELKPGSKIVSHRWDMGKWRPDLTLKAYGTTVYLWVVPANIEGSWRVTLRNERDLREFNLSVRQDFQKIRVTLTDGKRGYTVEDASLQGSEVSVSVYDAIRGKPFKMNLEGIAKGETIEGTASVREGDSSSVVHYWLRAERVLR